MKSQSLQKDYKIITIPSQKTGSDSEMYILKNRHTGLEYFMKMVVKKTDRGQVPDYYSLFKNEISIYKYLKKELIDKYQVRNILPLKQVGTLTYEQWFQLVRGSPLTKDLPDIQIYRNMIIITEYMIEERDTLQPILALRGFRPTQSIRNIDKFRYAYMMTPMIKGDYPHFGELLKELSIQEISRYMSILFFTIYQMLKVGINHNDLHFGNILVNNLDPFDFKSRYYLIATPEFTYLINLPYTLMIYDFDRSAVKKRHNPYLEDYAVYGNCPDFHPRRDILKVICGLYRIFHFFMKETTLAIKNEELIDFLEHMLDRLITDEYIQERIRNTTNCFLEMDDEPAIGCQDEYLDNGVASIGQTLGFFLHHANFQSVYTQDLIRNDLITLEFATRKMSKDFRNRFIPKKSNLDRFVKANIQITESFNGHKKLVKNIRDFIGKNIQ